MIDEKASLLRDPEIEWVVVKVPSTGLRHYSGIASSYSTVYPDALRPVLSKEEFVDIFSRLNETIRDYWPCNTCYFFGYGCCLCTAGLSVLVPGYCISHSELYANAMLKSVSLKATYYDRNISFSLSKSLCSSCVEVRFPAALLLQEAAALAMDVEAQIEAVPLISTQQPAQLKKQK